MAAEIAWASIKLAFAQGMAWVTNAWAEFSTGLASIFDGAVICPNRIAGPKCLAANRSSISATHLLPVQKTLYDSRMEPEVEKCDDVTFDEMLPWLELGCWTALVLAPILYYINGPSVSTDQAVVRTGLVIVSAVGACVLRYANWRKSRQAETGE